MKILILYAEKDNDPISSTSQIAQVGDRIKLQCHNAENIKWYFEKIKFKPETPPISDGNTLVIDSIKSRNGGTYFCYGKYVDKPTHFLAKSQIKVYGEVLFSLFFIVIIIIRPKKWLICIGNTKT